MHSQPPFDSEHERKFPPADGHGFAQLPAWFLSGQAVTPEQRSLYEAAYEQALRNHALDRLFNPDHYQE